MARPSLQSLRDRLRSLIISSGPRPLGRSDQPLTTPSSDGSWPDIDYADQTKSDWKPRTHLLRAQALAYEAVADTSRIHAALTAIRFWIERDPLSQNWWHNQIGAPRMLAQSLLLLGEHASPALLADSRKILERAGDFIFSEDTLTRKPMRWTGANRLWISANQLIAGALLENESLVVSSLGAAMAEIRISSRHEEGIQADASFHQHGPLLYNGGYGIAYLSECLFFLESTHGTAWQADLDRYRQLADFLLDGTRWMLRGADINHSCRDREITRQRQSNAGIARIAAFLADADVERAHELRDLAQAVSVGRAPGTVAGNRMFYRSDFMVQQSAAAAISVRMYSERTVRAEVCNGESLLSHHVADGLTLLLNHGAEYRDIFPVWDWQKLPGTTCVQTTQPESPETVWRRGTRPTTGGVSDGRYGACLQHLDCDGLVARKSWFFGPEGIFCLGTGIQSACAGRAVTTLDQSLIQGAVETDMSLSPYPPGRHALDRARWLKHGPWGFVFLKPTALTLELGSKTGAWSHIGTGSTAEVSQDVFLAYVDHGEKPTDACYAWRIIPGADRPALDHAVVHPTAEVVAQTNGCHAIWRPDVRLVQAVFFTAGNLSWDDGHWVSVDRPCALMLSCADASSSWTINVADVEQTGGCMNIELRSPIDGVRHHRVTLPEGDHCGRTVRVA